MNRLPSRQPLLATLEYFHKFSYPLTLNELYFWQHGSSLSQTEVRKHIAFLKSRSQVKTDGIYLSLPDPSRNVGQTRMKRLKISRKKWIIAKRVGEYLSHIPTIEAILVTGSLAMNNSDKLDDIDMMIVTTPHTLWTTRIMIVLALKLKNLRRPPHIRTHSSKLVSDKICDNLYLDSNRLRISPTKFIDQNIFLSHEILQAKPVFDKTGACAKFVRVNTWVKKYLPVAYATRLQLSKYPPSPKHPPWIFRTALSFTNLFAFGFQFLYMRPKMTSEKIGLGFAYFHPLNNKQIPS